MSDGYLTDWPVSERFPHYTRANAGEVMGDPVSPLGWTLGWDTGFEDFNDGEPSRSVGVSHVVFDDDGRVLIHQDYWDAASHFFVLLPFGKIVDVVKDRL